MENWVVKIPKSLRSYYVKTAHLTCFIYGKPVFVLLYFWFTGRDAFRAWNFTYSDCGDLLCYLAGVLLNWVNAGGGFSSSTGEFLSKSTVSELHDRPCAQKQILGKLKGIFSHTVIHKIMLVTTSSS